MEQKREKPLLSIEGLVTTFRMRGGSGNAVDNVRLTIARGETVGLVGESGCGKSMTAMSVMGLLPDMAKITAGKIDFAGEDLAKYTRSQMLKITGDRISMIFQEPMTSLNPVKTVGHQVREAILLHQKVSRKEAKARVVDIFKKVGIP